MCVIKTIKTHFRNLYMRDIKCPGMFSFSFLPFSCNGAFEIRT